MSQLRAATAADHDAVEATMPLMRESLTPAEYGAVLRQIHGVSVLWEESSLRAAARLELPWLEELLRACSRVPLLEKDLRALGETTGAIAGPAMPEWRSASEILGAMYVMEGSRLGGKYIAEHISRVLPAAAGATEFFRSGGESLGPAWKKKLALIEREVPDEEAESCIGAAKNMFRIFGAWLLVLHSAKSDGF